MLAPIYTKCSTISADNIAVYSARIVCLLMFAYVWECLFVRDRGFSTVSALFTLLLPGQ